MAHPSLHVISIPKSVDPSTLQPRGKEQLYSHPSSNTKQTHTKPITHTTPITHTKPTKPYILHRKVLISVLPNFRLELGRGVVQRGGRDRLVFSSTFARERIWSRRGSTHPLRVDGGHWRTHSRGRSQESERAREIVHQLEIQIWTYEGRGRDGRWS